MLCCVVLLCCYSLGGRRSVTGGRYRRPFVCSERSKVVRRGSATGKGDHQVATATGQVGVRVAQCPQCAGTYRGRHVTRYLGAYLQLARLGGGGQ
ncbi:hypothetical protein F4859DRAFT_465913 [Xylaria cf. heliscus]|nr:hypothetical protein F4859DRAFT_465913 [Xylaria cf. heliscus]